MNDTILNNRYQIVKQLSTKPGRRIFMAQDLQSGNLVIVKILLLDPDFKWKEHELFEREAQTLKNLNHPAIPKYLDYFDIGINNYHGFALVQTYIDAPSLESLIQEGRKFSEDELVELADKILSILDYLHRQNPIIIHRDIKPSNILLTNRSGNSIGEVYLVDFGCVQISTSKEYGTFSVVGTYGYIPPEQFGGKAVPASDLYSLGMTIIFLVKGIHPAELIQANGQYKIEVLQLTKRFQKWLEKITNVNLDQRFNSAQVAQDSLRANNPNLSYYSEIKPANTKVKICYNDNHIEMIFSDKIASIYEVFFWLISASMIVFLMPIVTHFFPGLEPVNVLILSLIIWYLIVAFISINLNQSEGKRVFKLIINANKIIAFGAWNQQILSNSRSEISLLGYAPSYEFDRFLDSTDDRQKRGKVITEPELFICAGLNKYLIKYLSTEEFWWLGHELSVILNLKLNIIYPTQKVPPNKH